MTAKEIEKALVRQSPAVWMELHGAILDKERGLLRNPDLKLNEMQVRIDAIILYCESRGIPCRMVTLKGRQQGSSTISIAAAYQMCRSRNIKCCVIGDEYEKSVKNLVVMFDAYAKNDSFEWGNAYTATNGTFSHGSVLVTETANDPRAGASGTMQCVIATEVAHWKETGVISGRKTFAALLSCVPLKPGTLVIVESTPNGTGGVYHATYQGAITMEDHAAGRVPAGWNGFFKIFYPWHAHPEYRLDVSEDVAVLILGSLSEREVALVAMGLGVDRLAWRRQVLATPAFDGDEESFEQEYPADEESCFLASGRRLFPAPAVQGLRKRARRPDFGVLTWVNDRDVAWQPCAEDDAFLKVWHYPAPGRRYNLPVDPMTGGSGVVGADPDNHGAGILREGHYDHEGVWRPLSLTARLADCWAEKRHKRGGAVCNWDIDVLTERIALLATWHGGATAVIESNMDRGIIELLREKYPWVNLYRRMAMNRVKQIMSPVFGWKTDIATRAMLLENLVRRVRLFSEPGDGIEVLDESVIIELGGVIVMPNGRAEAMTGQHDDQVFMLGIGAATMDAGHIMPFPRLPLWERDEREHFGESTYT